MAVIEGVHEVEGSSCPGLSLTDLLPWELPAYSRRVKRAHSYLLSRIADIDDAALRQAVRQMLAATKGGGDGIWLTRLSSVKNSGDCTMEKMVTALPYDPIFTAPGAGLQSHHCYPGGFCIHTAINLQAAEHLIAQAKALKGVTVAGDEIIAALVLHDWAKLKLLVWHDDHGLDDDQGLGHHVLALAECMLRGFPVRVVELLAGVHGGWWINEEAVLRSVGQAAELVAGEVDVAPYVKEKRLQLSLADWIVRQAEVSWYTATRDAVQAVKVEIIRWWEARRIPCEPARVANIIFTLSDELQLCEVRASPGPDGLWDAFDRLWYGT